MKLRATCQAHNFLSNPKLQSMKCRAILIILMPSHQVILLNLLTAFKIHLSTLPFRKILLFESYICHLKAYGKA